MVDFTNNNCEMYNMNELIFNIKNFALLAYYTISMLDIKIKLTKLKIYEKNTFYNSFFNEHFFIWTIN